jgi:hypothetical protein
MSHAESFADKGARFTKQYVFDICHMLNQVAGKGKNHPDRAHCTRQINVRIAELKNTPELLAQNPEWGVTFRPILTNWEHFLKEWKQGNGSWTTCLKYLAPVNERLQQIH